MNCRSAASRRVCQPSHLLSQWLAKQRRKHLMRRPCPGKDLIAPFRVLFIHQLRVGLFFIAFQLSLIRLVQADDMQAAIARREHQGLQTLANETQGAIAALPPIPALPSSVKSSDPSNGATHGKGTPRSSSLRSLLAGSTLIFSTLMVLTDHE